MKRHSGKLRIIGGENKGRNIFFPATDGLRPTADRVRETLFNWLANIIEDSHCLDLYAGSGALGLEALSRGATKVVMVESNRKAADAIKQNLTNFGSESTSVICQNAISYLSKCEQKFDVVFLDPPYQSDLMQKSIEHISKLDILNQVGWVYIEHSSHTDTPVVPDNWQLHRSTKAGEARVNLYKTSHLKKIQV